MGILRDRMVEEMKLRNFSAATQESYLYAVTRLTKPYRRSPDQLDREQIRSDLLHLTVERKLSPNTIMGQIAGLRFFYNQTLGWDETKLFIPPRKQSSPLPEVFSANEVVRLIAALPALPERNAGLGIRVGGLYPVEFIVRIARSNQNKSLAVARCQSQRRAVFCCSILPASSPPYSLRGSLLVPRNYISCHPSSRHSLLSSVRLPRRSCYNPHRRRYLPLPTL
jgi:Phage integrase, N-terminal SAM-like domain